MQENFFLYSCPLSSGTRTKILVSGDRHLLVVDGYRGIRVFRPRQFVEEHLKKRLQQELIEACGASPAVVEGHQPAPIRQGALVGFADLHGLVLEGGSS